MTSIGQRIYELRNKHNFSQGDLAEKLDVSRQTISKWENDQSIPELDKIIALCDIFNVTIDYIARGITAEQADSCNDGAQPVKEKEPSPVMIKIDPNKKYTKMLPVGLGAIYCLSLIITFSMELTSYFTFLGTVTLGQTYIALGLNMFIAVSLLSGRLKLVIGAITLRCIYSIVQMVQSTTDLLSILSLLSFISIILIYFVKDKKASRVIFIAAIALIVGCEAYGIYLSSKTIWQITPDIVSFASSLVSSNFWGIVDIVVKIGICIALYRSSNPLPCFEVPESEYLKKSDVYVNMTKHILLLAFTFGIYNLVWIYKTTQGINALYKEYDKDELSKVILCAFVPFYQIYWFYSEAKKLDKLFYEENKNISSFAVTTLILAIFFPFFGAAILLQARLNDYCEKGKRLD